MQGKKISNEVSPQEMLRMRNEEHLSNAEIADRLDICRDTVVRYIGKQPGWMGRKKRPVSAPQPEQEQPSECIQPKPTLVIELQITNYAGQSARYKVTNMGTVEIIGGPEKLNKDELQTYIVELMEIYSQL